jgi:hypothetical protein
MPGERPFLCSICFQPVELKNCKIDADGRAVHEQCYTQRLLYEAPSKRPHIRNPPSLKTRRHVG